MKQERVSYPAYLRSAAWRKKRRQVLDRARGVCERCGAAALHVHHLSYARLGAEPLTDLEALCAGCHVREHPDKIALTAGAFLGNLPDPCRCGSEQAEIYVGDDEIFRVCIRCGDETRQPRRKRKRRSKSWKRRKQRRTRTKQAATPERRESAKLKASSIRLPRTPSPVPANDGWRPAWMVERSR